MRHTAALLMLLGLVASAHAAETGLLGTAPCRKAIDTLDREEARAGTSPKAAAGSAPARITPGLAQARRAVALACLGPGVDVAPAPPRRVEAPTTVPRIVMAPPASVPLPAAPTGAEAAAPLLQPRLPQVLSSCDTAGCWTSDGIRLQRVGPVLSGPRGVCSVAGNAVSCP